MTATFEQNVIWKPTKVQAEFLSCPAREALFGGSVGAGKTDALLMAAASQTGNPKCRSLFLRRTYPMLRDAVARSHELFLPLGATFNKQSSSWIFPSGSVLEFGFCDADGDEFRYMGRAFSGLFWDELTSWPDENAYIYMLSRLRAVERSGLRLEIRSSCTAGGVGHNWVRERFAIPDDGSASEVVDPETGYRRCFIPGRISDNVHLRGSEYERSLQALPEAKRKSLVLGFWNVFEGAVFSEWDSRIHVCEPFEIPGEWEMWRGADDGYAAPAAILWLALDPIHDRIYVVDELYQSKLTPQELGRAILLIDAEFGRELDGVIDSASFADVGMGGGRANVMNALGLNWRPAEKGPGSRIAGIAAIHRWLSLRSDGWPGLVVFNNCRNLIRTLPALTYSNTNREDIGNCADDHCCDALRYALGRKVTSCRVVRVRGL